jgi:hypothetical protein
MPLWLPCSMPASRGSGLQRPPQVQIGGTEMGVGHQGAAQGRHHQGSLPLREDVCHGEVPYVLLLGGEDSLSNIVFG